jgi:putative transposon-encoded protein
MDEKNVVFRRSFDEIQVREVHEARKKNPIGHIYLPKEWIGKKVYVILAEDTNDG